MLVMLACDFDLHSYKKPVFTDLQEDTGNRPLVPKALTAVTVEGFLLFYDLSSLEINIFVRVAYFTTVYKLNK